MKTWPVLADMKEQLQLVQTKQIIQTYAGKEKQKEVRQAAVLAVTYSCKRPALGYSSNV